MGHSLDDLIEWFLSSKRIAVWGVEPGKRDPGAWVARRLRRQGAEAVEISPAFAAEHAADGGSEGALPERAASLTTVDPPVEGVLACVDPPQAMAAVEDCIAAGVPLVWLHDAMSPGAATAEAIERLREAAIAVIPGLCPMLFLRPADPAHCCLRWVLRINGKERCVRRSAERLQDSTPEEETP